MIYSCKLKLLKMKTEYLLWFQKNLHKKLELKSKLNCTLFVGIEIDSFASVKSEINIELKSGVIIFIGGTYREDGVCISIDGIITIDIPPNKSIYFHCNIEDLMKSTEV